MPLYIQAGEFFSSAIYAYNRYKKPLQNKRPRPTPKICAFSYYQLLLISAISFLDYTGYRKHLSIKMDKVEKVYQ